MKKTREIVQQESFKALKDNNYNGTICLSTGTGKSKVAIDVIKQNNFKNILITSPRTNLKENWKRELEKWGINIHPVVDFNRKNEISQTIFTDSIHPYTCKCFTLENIQTCYKWSSEQLNQYDLIVCDEIHVIATEKYGELIKKAKAINIPVIGLTATPDNKKEDKQLFYEKYCPIIYEYYDSAKDGIINKRRYLIYNYNLSDDYEVQINTKKNSWKEGELKRYTFIETVLTSSKHTIEEYYFNNIKRVIGIINKRKIKESYKKYFNSLISKDLEYFRTIYWIGMKNKKFPYDLYLLLREIQGVDYAKFGMKAAYWAKAAPKSIRPYFYKYIWARDERKKFLWNLNSSSIIALKFKKSILSNIHNKVLLFSENITQAEKLSEQVIHSKRKSKVNIQILEDFNNNITRELASVRSLTLGLNIKEANYIIRESYNGSSVNSKQINGRSDRLNIDDIATVIWIVPVETQAEQWFNNAIEKEDCEINYYTDINSLIKDL